MKPIIYLTFLILTLTTSCAMDYFVYAKLCNETKDTICLKLEFDTTYIKEKFSYLNRYDVLKSPYADSGVIILKTDSIRYIKEFLVYPSNSIMVGGGNAIPFFWYSKLKVFHKKDSIVIVGRENIDTLFKKIGSNEFIYSVK